MIELNIPEGKPVAIWTSYRTGSTAFCDRIAQETGRKNFDEAYHPTLFKERHAQFMEYKKENRDFVFKIMSDQITNDNGQDFADLFNNSYRIKLYREDVVGQIASWYVSHMTDFWHATDKNQLEIQDIELKDDIISWAIKSIQWNNAFLHQFDSNAFDVVYSYEQLTDGKEIDSQYRPRNRPNNYEELLHIIRTKIAEQGES